MGTGGIKMTLEEAVKLWVTRDFSNIPTSLILKAYKDDPYELELLSSDFPVYAYPSGGGWLFHPEDSYDEHWIPLYKARGFKWHK